MKFSFGDTLTSFISGLGVKGYDKRASAHYQPNAVSLLELQNAYFASWIAEKIVDIPVDDALRKSRLWQALPDQISAIEAEEARLGLYSKLERAMKLARRDGGAAIYIATGDNDVGEPLNTERMGVGGVMALTVLTMTECRANELEDDIESPFYGLPRTYSIGSGKHNRVNVHPTRLIRFVGKPVLDPFARGGNGWGQSVLMACYNAVRDADATISNIASLVYEANVDIFKIDGLLDRIGEKGFEERLLKRFGLANHAKSTSRALLMDKTEDFAQKQINFSSLPEVLREFLQIVSGAAGIPLTRFLGTSPSGLNSNGDSDIQIYHDKVQAIQELDLRVEMAGFDEVLIRSALGDRPSEVFYIWPSLKQLSDKERADIAKVVSSVTKELIDSGQFTPDQLQKSVINELTNIGFFAGIEAEINDAGAATAFDAVFGDLEPRTLYVSRKVVNASDLIKWAKSQGIDETLTADDLHVTIIHSKSPVDWFSFGEAWDDEVKIGSGGARALERFDGGAVVLRFASNQLEWRHERFVEGGASWDWPEYQPHITLTYKGENLNLDEIEPYQGEIILGHERFEEVDNDWKIKVEHE